MSFFLLAHWELSTYLVAVQKASDHEGMGLTVKDQPSIDVPLHEQMALWIIVYINALHLICVFVQNHTFICLYFQGKKKGEKVGDRVLATWRGDSWLWIASTVWTRRWDCTSQNNVRSHRRRWHVFSFFVECAPSHIQRRNEIFWTHVHDFVIHALRNKTTMSYHLERRKNPWSISQLNLC